MDSAAQAPTSGVELRWTNGDVLPGRLLESQPGRIRWSSPVFAETLVVDPQVLEAIVFPGVSVDSSEPLRVVTTSGDVLAAGLVAADDRAFLFSSERHGRFRVDRDAVYALQRRTRPDLVFDGSQLKHWDLDAEAPIRDLRYRVYQEDRGWNGGGFPDLSRLKPVDEGRLAAGYLDLGLAEVQGRFALVFEGRLETMEEGPHQFDLWADDKAQLFIDGHLTVASLERGGRNAAGGGHSKRVHLRAGFHSLRVEYLELGAGGRLVANLTGPDSRTRSLVGVNPGSGWTAGLGGYPQTDRSRAGLFRELELPKRFTIDLALASSESPRFVLALARDPRSAESTQALRLEAWDNEWVVAQDNVFTSVMTLDEDRREMRLRLTLDGELGEIRAFDGDGRPLGRLTGIRAETGSSGIYVRNRGRDLTVRRLSVKRGSDERAGPPVDSSRARVHLTGDEVVYGELYVDEGGAYVAGLGGQRQLVDLARVDRIERPDVRMGVAPDSVELSYSDGAVVRGRLEQARPEHVVLRTSFSGIPVVCALAGADLLRFSLSTTRAQPPRRAGDQLFCAPGQMRGQLVFDRDDAPLCWKPEGAEASLRLAMFGGTRIERSPERVSRDSSLDTNRFPHVVHLKTGEIFPCKVIAYTRQTLGFESPWISGGLVASSHVKGIEFVPLRENPLRERQREVERGLDDGLELAEESLREDAIRLRRALTVPRFNRYSPPSHILVARNGDLKRGALIGITAATVQFESKLRTFLVPIDRLTRVVDIVNPEERDVEKSGPSVGTLGGAGSAASSGKGTLRAVLADGSVLILEPRAAKDGELSGHSSIYGATTLPIDRIQTLTLGECESEDRESLFAEWIAHPAPEPQFNE